MGLTRRILEGARTGLSQLTSLVIVDDEPLSAVEASALEAELTARRAARQARPAAPEDNPVARMAGAGAAARAARQRAFTERTARVRQARAAAAARARQAAEDEFARIKDQAARGGRPGGGGGGGGGGAGGARRPAARGADSQVAEWYRVLDVQPGADLAAIKSAYRKLMRKYHPDLFAGDARKQKAATELSMRVTNAYNGLREHLGEK